MKCGSHVFVRDAPTEIIEVCSDAHPAGGAGHASHDGLEFMWSAGKTSAWYNRANPAHGPATAILELLAALITVKQMYLRVRKAFGKRRDDYAAWTLVKTVHVMHNSLNSYRHVRWCQVNTPVTLTATGHSSE